MNYKISTGISKDYFDEEVKITTWDKYPEDNGQEDFQTPEVEEFPTHSTGAKREKLNSIRYDYMPSRIVNESYARVAAFGAKKYAPDNWMKGIPQSQISSSLQRHLWAYLEGQDVDSETGLSHLDHVLWNAVAMVYNENHPNKDKGFMDDRFEERKNVN